MVNAPMRLVLATLLASILVIPARADDPPGEKARRARCRDAIEALGASLVRYKEDHGSYPPDGGVRGEPTALVIYLDGDPSNGGPATAYYDFEPHLLRGLTYLDPWGNPYLYDELLSEDPGEAGDPAARPPACVRVASFDLWSTAGRPESEDGREWITNYGRPFDGSAPEAELRPVQSILGDLVRETENLARVLESVDSVEAARAAAATIRDASARIADAEAELEGSGTPGPEEREAMAADLDLLYAAGRRIDRISQRLWTGSREVWGIVAEAAGDHGPLVTIDRALRTRCWNRLRAIGVALQLWRDLREGDEVPLGNPGLFRSLAESGVLSGAEAFLCPDSGSRAAEGEFRSDYETWSEGRIAPEIDAAGFPIAWDSSPERHAGRRNVLFLDGRVVEISEEEFRALVARWTREGFKQ